MIQIYLLSNMQIMKFYLFKWEFFIVLFNIVLFHIKMSKLKLFICFNKEMNVSRSLNSMQ